MQFARLVDEGSFRLSSFVYRNPPCETVAKNTTWLHGGYRKGSRIAGMVVTSDERQSGTTGGTHTGAPKPRRRAASPLQRKTDGRHRDSRLLLFCTPSKMHCTTFDTETPCSVLSQDMAGAIVRPSPGGIKPLSRRLSSKFELTRRLSCSICRAVHSSRVSQGTSLARDSECVLAWTQMQSMATI